MHSIMLRGYLDVFNTFNKDDIGKVKPGDITKWIDRLREIATHLGAEDDPVAKDELIKLVGKDVADAKEEFSEEEDNHLPALLYHWSESLGKLPEYASEAMEQTELDKLYNEFDEHAAARKRESTGGKSKEPIIPVRFKKLSSTEVWPVGLDRKKLASHGENVLEIFNRLWQLFIFAKNDVFAPSRNYRITKENKSRKEKEYTASTAGAHLPTWWGEKPDMAKLTSQFEQHADELDNTQTRPKQVEAPTLRCKFANVNLKRSADEWLAHFESWELSADHFAANENKLPNPCQYPDQAAWRNILKEFLELRKFYLVINTISLKVMSGEVAKSLKIHKVFDVNTNARASHDDVVELFRLDDATRIEVFIQFELCENAVVDDAEFVSWEHDLFEIVDGQVRDKQSSNAASAAASTYEDDTLQTNVTGGPSVAAREDDEDGDADDEDGPPAG